MPVPHAWRKRPTLSLEITKTCECWQVTSVCHMINNISCNLQCNIIVRHVAEQITCVTLPPPPPLPPPLVTWNATLLWGMLQNRLHVWHSLSHLHYHPPLVTWNATLLWGMLQNRLHVWHSLPHLHYHPPPPCDLKCNKELKDMLWKRSISCNLRDEISPPSDFIYGIAQDGIVGVIIFMVWFEGDFHVGLTMFLLYMTNAVFSSEASWGKGE